MCSVVMIIFEFLVGAQMVNIFEIRVESVKNDEDCLRRYFQKLKKKSEGQLGQSSVPFD